MMLFRLEGRHNLQRLARVGKVDYKAGVRGHTDKSAISTLLQSNAQLGGAGLTDIEVQKPKGPVIER
jgi:hypothetical protein